LISPFYLILSLTPSLGPANTRTTPPPKSGSGPWSLFSRKMRLGTYHDFWHFFLASNYWPFRFSSVSLLCCGPKIPFRSLPTATFFLSKFQVPSPPLIWTHSLKQVTLPPSIAKPQPSPKFFIFFIFLKDLFSDFR